MRLVCWYKRRWVLFLIYFFLGTTVLYSLSHVLETNLETIQCYRIKTEETLPDISEVEPRKGQSIFFHETSCRSYQKGKIVIESRQACAVESTARLNPNFDIYLLYSSPGIIKYDGDESDRLLHTLMSYKNVYIMHLDFKNYTKGTPVESLYSSGQIENSLHVVSHASDVLRYLTLWKYGGIYMDLDVVLLKSIEDLKSNFAAIESNNVVASGVLSFEPTGNGHKMVEDCLNDLKVRFDGKLWANNGPGVITRLLKSMCTSINTTEEIMNVDCGGFTLLPPSSFYPVPWQKWWMYFDEKFLETVANFTQDSFAIHTWNKLSHERHIPLDSNVPYLNIARKKCPNVIEACDKVF